MFIGSQHQSLAHHNIITSSSQRRKKTFPEASRPLRLINIQISAATITLTPASSEQAPIQLDAAVITAFKAAVERTWRWIIEGFKSPKLSTCQEEEEEEERDTESIYCNDRRDDDGWSQRGPCCFLFQYGKHQASFLSVSVTHILTCSPVIHKNKEKQTQRGSDKVNYSSAWKWCCNSASACSTGVI